MPLLAFEDHLVVAEPVADAAAAAEESEVSAAREQLHHPTPNEQAALGFLLACILAYHFARPRRRREAEPRGSKRATTNIGVARFQRVASCAEDDLVEL